MRALRQAQPAPDLDRREIPDEQVLLRPTAAAKYLDVARPEAQSPRNEGRKRPVGGAFFGGFADCYLQPITKRPDDPLT